jgi:hypothetical protein
MRIAGPVALLGLLTACGGADPVPLDEQIPEHGSGGFVAAPGSETVTGAGQTLITYQIEVETGVEFGAVDPVTADVFAAAVERVLADPRGWAAHPVTDVQAKMVNASWRFQRVAGPDAQVRLRLATPQTVDAQCARIGLDTEGKFSCRFDNTIMVNLKRWLQGSPISPSVDEYHAGVVNHEVGHFLGFDHASCPGTGQPAPVMMQQSIDLGGCEPNAWPFSDAGAFITGPWQPS